MSVYLDVNAGIHHPSILIETMNSLSMKKKTLMANPSSIHFHGRQAKKALSDAREQVGLSFGLKKHLDQLTFTSSGTEANQLAIRSILEPKLDRGEKPHWVTTVVEHDSNRQMIEWLRRRGGRISELTVDEWGRPQLEQLEGFLCSETALISVLWVNNETGVITDLDLLTQIAQGRNIPIHIDAAQAWGKLPCHLETMGVQLASFSGHKIGGLAGTGVLWSTIGLQIGGTILGKQEKSRRGGTENVLGIISLGIAAKKINPLNWSKQIQPLRDQLEQKISESIKGTCINGKGVDRIANTSNISFEHIHRESLVIALDLSGYSVSAGSACSSGTIDPSHVLLAMGKTREQAISSIRISLSNDELPENFIMEFTHKLYDIVEKIRHYKE